jgi:hypothetical protein
MRALVVLWMFLSSLSLSCSADTPHQESASTEWLVYDASELVAGRTLSEWAIEWNRWSFAQTSCDSALTDNDGSGCALYQDSENPVFFLSFAPSRATRASCPVPDNKPILVPLVTSYSDNVNEDPPLPDAELEQYMLDALASMHDVTLVVDGKTIEINEERAVGPVRHTVMLPASPNFYSCNLVDGYENVLLDPVYLAGYFALLHPPPPGERTLSYSGSQETFDIAYTQEASLRFEVAGP